MCLTIILRFFKFITIKLEILSLLALVLSHLFKFYFRFLLKPEILHQASSSQFLTFKSHRALQMEADLMTSFTILTLEPL